MRPVPQSLHGRPFTTQEALRLGVTPNQLRGPQFTRTHRGVYVVTGTELKFPISVAAARMALPPDARLSHASRLRMLGLEYGPAHPIEFTVARDHHVTPAGVFLHRTDVMPPVDDIGVTPASAFIGLAAQARPLDLIGVGDWLLHRNHMSEVELREVALRHEWRAGASAALAVVPALNGRAASIPESHSRAIMTFAGLPEPEVNVPIFDTPASPIADLYLRELRLVFEYEGDLHVHDREQIKRDAWRYAWMRDEDIAYVPIYAEMLASPRTLVTHVHRILTSRGYDGPPPEFGRRWRTLFAPARPWPVRRLEVG